jgi:hypothetical protein
VYCKRPQAERVGRLGVKTRAFRKKGPSCRVNLAHNLTHAAPIAENARPHKVGDGVEIGHGAAVVAPQSPIGQSLHVRSFAAQGRSPRAGHRLGDSSSCEERPLARREHKSEGNTGTVALAEEPMETAILATTHGMEGVNLKYLDQWWKIYLTWADRQKS